MSDINGKKAQMAMVPKILRGEMSLRDVERELERISSEYGEDCFNSYPVSRKPAPWTREDLDELRVLSASGAASKEFYRYMAEVSEAVHAKEKSALPNKRYSYAGIVGAAVILIVILLLIMVE